MSSELSLEYLVEVVPKTYKKLVNQDTVDEINSLASDPDYGVEFRESMLTYSGILGGTERWSMTQYMDAVKYYSLTVANSSQTDAYIKVFPDRLQSRLDRGEDRSNIAGEASRYNKTDIVNKIRQQALVPFHLYNQGTLQQAIDTAQHLMLHARSDKVRGDMALGLIKELRPPEAQQVELQIGLDDKALDAQNKQTEQLVNIAENQRRLLEAGMSIDEVQQIHVEKVYVDAEIEEEE